MFSAIVHFAHWAENSEISVSEISCLVLPACVGLFCTPSHQATVPHKYNDDATTSLF